MTLRIDRMNIAKAMRDAALKAKYGTREEQSGRFIAVKVGSREARPAAPVASSSKR